MSSHLINKPPTRPPRPAEPRLRPVQFNAIYRATACFHEALAVGTLYHDVTNFDEFPHECCDSASNLLATFLYEKGLGDATLMQGKYFSRPHIWLRLHGLTIDITAYQFPPVTERVIVAYRSPFHESLGGFAEGFADHFKPAAARQAANPAEDHAYRTYRKAAELAERLARSGFGEAPGN